VRAHLAYLRYVLSHKWHVFRACLELGVPLWIAVVHDWTKFTLREWVPYVRQFFNPDGSKRNVRDKSGAYDPNAQPAEFKAAWCSHQKNRHHWQGWTSLGDGGTLSPLPIPEVFCREMVADWIGAGRAQGKCDPHGWYLKNHDNLVLHPESRATIEKILENLCGCKSRTDGR